MRALVLAVRFGTELAALAALAVTGADLTDGAPSVALAVLLPLADVAAWGRYVAPASRHRLTDPPRAIVELAIFTAAVAGLAIAGHTALAIILGVAVAITAPATRHYEPAVTATA